MPGCVEPRTQLTRDRRKPQQLRDGTLLRLGEG
jgi:hypothetical protein